MLICEKLKETSQFSNSEIAVADKVLELKDQIENYSIRELAKECFTATSSVTRLCVKLGFNGYKDFRKKYVEEIHYLNTHFEGVDANIPFTKEDDLSKVTSSISKLYKETVDDTLNLLDHFFLIEAVKYIENAKNVYVLCIGTSIYSAKIFAERMMRIGKNIIVSDNVNEQYYQSFNSSKEDVFIVISYSGTTFKTKQYLDNIHKNHAKCILITSIGDHSYKALADVVLTMSTRERLYTNIAKFSSTISTELILDFIYSTYFHNHYDEAFEKKTEIAKSYEPNRKASSNIMKE